eukprot:TRINITY_DN1267_c0_g2_i1.p1 TRINITY_DN1267_c0_g2~~TRINITY_DN1267_c0_g2_i1.p1  ORF type:complete len:407 (-),score=104.96 TRINITY_DN1267_c0_g2_i1:149-1369(-)
MKRRTPTLFILVFLIFITIIFSVFRVCYFFIVCNMFIQKGRGITKNKKKKMKNVALYLLVIVLAINSISSQSTGPSKGVFNSNFLVSVSGETENNNSFNLVNNTGTMTIRGQKYVALAYWTQVMEAWGDQDVWWINVVGIAEDSSNLAIVYIDCTDNKLQSDFWEEDWDTFLYSESIQQKYVGQSCQFTRRYDWQTKIQMPSLNTIPSTTVDTKITITGQDVGFYGDHGWLIIDHKNFTVLPISYVNCFNCLSNCGPENNNEKQIDNTDTNPYCYSGPWYEIHHAATYTENDNTVTCFGIFYLFEKDHSFVQWNYTYCLPQNTSPQILYSANWEGKLPRNPQPMIEHMNKKKITNNDQPITFDSRDYKKRYEIGSKKKNNRDIVNNEMEEQPFALDSRDYYRMNKK